MKNSRRVWLGLGLVVLGCAAGIYLQHRWPLGRLMSTLSHQPTPALRGIKEVAALPAHRRLVVVAAGQSNAANYGTSRRAAGPAVFVFAHGTLFAAVDPLPGGDGDGGSIWSRLGAQLALTGRYDAVVFAVVAVGSTRIEDWTTGGRCHRPLIETLQQLTTAGLPAEYLLWIQGESEAGSSSASGLDYLAKLTALQAAVRETCPTVKFVVAQSTRTEGVPANEQIRMAQSAAARLPGALPGPDLDQLGPPFRSDGVHFNDRGLSAAATLWAQALQLPAPAAVVPPSPP